VRLSNCVSGALRSTLSAMRRLSLLSLPASSVSKLSAGCVCRAGPRLSMPVATTEDADDTFQAFIEGRADDDVGVLVGLFAVCG